MLVGCVVSCRQIVGEDAVVVAKVCRANPRGGLPARRRQRGAQLGFSVVRSVRRCAVSKQHAQNPYLTLIQRVVSCHQVVGEDAVVVAEVCRAHSRGGLPARRRQRGERFRNASGECDCVTYACVLNTLL